MSDDIVHTPGRVHGHYDEPLWQSIGQRTMRLQCCDACGAWQYPPGPGCSKCLSEELSWSPLSGGGSILSWVIFHRQYLAAYPAPFNVIAVKLDEGPVMISNLQGQQPAESWIGRRVRLVYMDMPDGVILPRFELDE